MRLRLSHERGCGPHRDLLQRASADASKAGRTAEGRYAAHMYNDGWICEEHPISLGQWPDSVRVADPCVEGDQADG